MFVCKVKGSKLLTVSPILLMILPCLCMLDLGLGCFSVWMKKAARRIAIF